MEIAQKEEEKFQSKQELHSISEEPGTFRPSSRGTPAILDRDDGPKNNNNTVPSKLNEL